MLRHITELYSAIWCLPVLQLLPTITDYVSSEMGPRFVEPVPFAIEPSYNDSSAVSPLIFVLSPGSDPMTSLLKYADDKVGTQGCVALTHPVGA